MVRSTEEEQNGWEKKRLGGPGEEERRPPAVEYHAQWVAHAGDSKRSGQGCSVDPCDVDTGGQSPRRRKRRLLDTVELRMSHPRVISSLAASRCRRGRMAGDE